MTMPADPEPMSQLAALRHAVKSLTGQRNEACHKLADFNRQSFEGKRAFDETLTRIIVDDLAIDALEALIAETQKENGRGVPA